MENIRIPYVEKGTPRDVSPRHKGDFKKLRQIQLFKKQKEIQLNNYRAFLLSLQLKNNTFNSSI